MAVLGSIGTAVYRHEIPAAAPAAARETLGGALAVADRLPGRTGSLATAAREAFTSGMQGAAIAGAVLLVGAAAAGGGDAAAESEVRKGAPEHGTGEVTQHELARERGSGGPGIPVRPAVLCGKRQTRFTARADVAPISSAISVSTAGGHRVVDGQDGQRLAAGLARATTCMPAMLMPGLAEDPADRADDTRDGPRTRRTTMWSASARSTSYSPTATIFWRCLGPASVPETDDLLAVGERAAHGDDVAVVGRLRAGGQPHLDAALLREQRGVDVRHRLVDDVLEDALERGQLQHLHVVLGDLAVHLDVEADRDLAGERGEDPAELLGERQARA